MAGISTLVIIASLVLSSIVLSGPPFYHAWPKPPAELGTDPSKPYIEIGSGPSRPNDPHWCCSLGTDLNGSHLVHCFYDWYDAMGDQGGGGDGEVKNFPFDHPERPKHWFDVAQPIDSCNMAKSKSKRDESQASNTILKEGQRPQNPSVVGNDKMLEAIFLSKEMYLAAWLEYRLAPKLQLYSAPIGAPLKVKRASNVTESQHPTVVLSAGLYSPKCTCPPFSRCGWCDSDNKAPCRVRS